MTTSYGPIEVEVTCLAAEPDAVHAAAALLSADEQHRARRLVFERDRRRFIVARARLRELLAERLGGGGGGVRADSIEFEYGAHGKPTLSRRFAGSELHFSVSHCADVATYAFSRGAIGIDVEAVRVMADADELAARYFSRGEHATYRTLDARDQPVGFFNCWTRKEAFIKAQGEGLGYPLDRFEVSLAPGEAAQLLRVGDKSGDACGWRLMSFSPAAGFVGAVVTASSGEAHG